MASSLILTIKSEKTQAYIQKLLEVNGNRKKYFVHKLVNFLHGMVSGQHRGQIVIQTGSAASVAATGTVTPATAIQNDTVTVAGVTLTAKDAPSGAVQFGDTVGSAAAIASGANITLAGVFTKTSHGLLTGDVGQMTTSGALPGGLAVSTDYYVIKLDANTFSLATSRANAQAGTAIKLSSGGTGTQTFTPSANKTVASRIATLINANTTLNTIVSADSSGSVCTITCLTPGVLGNFLGLTSSGATLAVSGSGTLTSGTGGPLDAATTYALGL